MKQNLKVAQDRKKINADKKITTKEYEVGEHVFLRVKLNKSRVGTGLYAKIAPRYVGPFEILARIGLVAYQMDLPPHIRIHDVFHIHFFIKKICC